MVADDVDADALARAIVDSASEFVVVVAPDATIVATNHNLAAELRYAADDLIGRSALDLIDPVDLPRALLVLSVSNDQGAPPGTVSLSFYSNGNRLSRVSGMPHCRRDSTNSRSGNRAPTTAGRRAATTSVSPRCSCASTASRLIAGCGACARRLAAGAPSPATTRLPPATLPRPTRPTATSPCPSA